METIKTIYNTIISNPEGRNCFYYSNQTIDKDSDGVSFIREYFSEGGKKDLFKDVDGNEIELLKQKMRAEHMRSVFLLGIYFYDHVVSLKNFINDLVIFLYKQTKKQNVEEVSIRNVEQEVIVDKYSKTFDYNSNEIRRDFLYLWFLICLYHDVGYIYELNEKNDDQIFNPKTIKKTEFFPEELMTYAFSYYVVRRFTNLLGGRPCVDHGIYGGMHMYSKLKNKHNSPTIITDYSENIPLNWGKPIMDNYITHAAWCIIGHNIFFAEDGSKSGDLYKLLGFNGLIYTRGESHISPISHPLLFLLCLVDTIEPIKHFFGDKNYSEEDTEKRMELSLSSNIHVSHGNTIYFSLRPDNKKSKQCRLDPPCQFCIDCNHCSRYSCNRLIANNLQFLISQEFSVKVNQKFIKLHFPYSS